MRSTYGRLLRPTFAAAIALLVAAGPGLANDYRDHDWRGGHQFDLRHGHRSPDAFERIATFPVVRNHCNGVAPEQLESCRNETTVAEIVAASEDGKTLIYTDSEQEQVGFVNIADPSNPLPGGVLPAGGSPTSVAVVGPYALIAVDTSPNFVAPSGRLLVVDMATRTIVRTMELGGQPDSVAISPDKRYAAIAIENQRDEDVEVNGVEGGLPQFPAGFLVIVDLVGGPNDWSIRNVELTGLALIAPEDPEPEFVDINEHNIAAVTLQENNHIALVDLKSGLVVRHFSAGDTTVEGVDTSENGIIELKDTVSDRRREPDAIKWLDGKLVTADEGDLDGGSRTFSVFRRYGKLAFDSGAALDHIAARHGKYPEDRSENKGTEPEGLEVAEFDGKTYLFVALERANSVAVYRVRHGGKPEFVQLLPTGVGPEGLKAIPKRGLFVVAAETDERGDAYRSAITIFRLQDGAPAWPSIVSADRKSSADVGAGLPIPWGALSALAADRKDATKLYSVHDSAYNSARIYVIDVDERPAVIKKEILLTKDGAPVDRDLEGLVQRWNGGFWAVSEGAGTSTTRNLLMEIEADGTIKNEYLLPDAVNALQQSNGFEGVAATGYGSSELVYVAFQRPWTGDPSNHVRIGVFKPSDQSWAFVYYPLDPVESPLGGNVGLSEIVAVGGKSFAVIERDNRGNDDARVKRIYEFSLDGVAPVPQGGVFPVVTKTLVRDLMPDLEALHGQVPDKIEGLTIAKDRKVYVVTDNDGVEDSTGETLFLRLGRLFDY